MCDVSMKEVGGGVVIVIRFGFGFVGWLFKREDGGVIRIHPVG